MALPHYEQRNQLVIDEVNAIVTVEERAQMLPEPFRGKILQSLREYIGARIEFVNAGSDETKILLATNDAKQLQNGMWQQSVMLVEQKTNVSTPLFLLALGQLADVIDQSLAAAEKRIPTPIWMILFYIRADLSRCRLQHATQAVACHVRCPVDGRHRTRADFRVG